MFGHIKGAFTDANSTRIGRFELADGGTLFLDEIANTPYSQQGKLLRVLEDSEFEKVGTSKTQTVDIRLITATNADLNVAIESGIFRKDLLYRINTVEIEIPPLRSRIEDIIPLAKFFLMRSAKKYSRSVLNIDHAASVALKSYSWPGNVRELNHVMERAQILCQTSCIKECDLGLGITTLDGLKRTEVTSDITKDLRSIKEIEMDAIQERLTHFRGDASETAKSLGLSRSALYRRLEKLKSDKF